MRCTFFNVEAIRQATLVRLRALRLILLLVVAVLLPEARVWGFGITAPPASGVFAPANPLSIGENYDGWQYDASDSSLAAKTGGPVRNVVQFEGMEVRAVRDLGHLDDAALRAMVDDGTAAASRSGDKLILHHLNQNPAGPLVEIPRPFHSTGNTIQHPLGTAPGVGLTKAERAAHNA